MDGEDVAAVLVGAPLECCRFFGREERLALELLRTLERRGGAEVPVTLQIRMSVGRARRRPARLRRKDAAKGKRDEATANHLRLHVRNIVGPLHQVVNRENELTVVGSRESIVKEVASRQSST